MECDSRRYGSTVRVSRHASLCACHSLAQLRLRYRVPEFLCHGATPRHCVGQAERSVSSSLPCAELIQRCDLKECFSTTLNVWRLGI